jgi:hypothetical protein
MKVFFFALFLGWFNASSAVAQISCDVLINGKVSFTLSKSETNVFTLNGTGCDSFELKAVSGIKLVKVEGGYEVSQIYDYIKSATIQIIGIKGKSRTILSNMNLQIVD